MSRDVTFRTPSFVQYISGSVGRVFWGQVIIRPRRVYCGCETWSTKTFSLRKGYDSGPGVQFDTKVIERGSFRKKDLSGEENCSRTYPT